MHVRPHPVRRFSAILSVFAVVIVVIATLLFTRSHVFRRSIPGRVVRWFHGEAGANQTVNDLAEDVRERPSLSRLQPWSIETLARFRSGQVHTNGNAAYLPFGSIRLAASERPEFVSHEWGVTNSFGEEEPEISVLLNSDGQPECVVISWYLYGIVAGTPDYHLRFQPWCYVEAKPGVYVYHLYK